MKKITLAVLAIVCTFFCAMGLAACTFFGGSGGGGGSSKFSFEDDGALYYELNSDGMSYTVVRPIADADELYSVTIPETFEGKPVTRIREYAFFFYTNLMSINIPDSIVYIDECAFNSCSRLSDITIGAGVKTIGAGAFAGCAPMELYIPDNVTTIGSGAFSGCEYLTEITLPFIGKDCNSGNSSEYDFVYAFRIHDDSRPEEVPASLRTVTITGGTAIKEYAFKNLEFIENITLPETLETIGNYAFYGCRFNELTIPESVKTIGTAAFYDCELLRELTIPDGVTQIGERLIERCVDLNELTLPFLGATKDDEDTATLKYLCGSNFSPDKLHSITINSGKVLAESAFYYCTGLMTVILPDEIEKIGRSAFFGCNALTYNECDDEGYYLGTHNNDYAVLIGVRNTAITSFEVKEETKIIYNGAFRDFTNLSSVILHEGITHIGAYAFYECSKLTSIEIPDSVKYIDGYALSYCSRLSSVKLGNGIKSIDDKYVFTSSNITDLEFGSSLENLNAELKYVKNINYTGDIASWCRIQGLSNIMKNGTDKTLIVDGTTLTELEIPSGVTEISDYAFYNYTKLTSISISESVTSIGEFTFAYCTGLQSITVDKNNATYSGAGNCIVETAKNTLILGCKNSNIAAAGTVTAIGTNAFYGCTGLREAVIPDSVKTIGDYAFYECTGMTTLSIGRGVTEISETAFRHCSGLVTISVDEANTVYSGAGYSLIDIAEKTLIVGSMYSTIPSDGSVLYIGSYAFYSGKTLTKITIPEPVKTIGAYAFYGCPNLQSVTIPNSVTSIGTAAFYKCPNLNTVTIQNGGDIEIGSYAFYQCTNLEALTLGDGVKSIGNYAFYQCSGLTNVVIPDKVEKIGDYAFYQCTALEELTIGSNVKDICSYAFYGCRSLTNVVIPDSVEKIWDYAFYQCTNLKEVTLGSGITRLSSVSFSCSKVIYNGTRAEWDAITKATNWNGVSNYELICTDD